MNTALRLTLLTLLPTLVPACLLRVQADVPESTQIDGPFEISVDMDDGLELSKVRAGLFHFEEYGVAILDDGTSQSTAATIDVQVSNDGRVDMLTYIPRDTVFFRPRLEALPDALGQLVVELPEDPAVDDEYRLVVWYDEDDNGLLTLSDTGPSEFARSPGREFPDEDDRRLILGPIRAGVGSSGPTGSYHADAHYYQSIGGGIGRLAPNAVTDSELTQWSVRIASDSQ